MAFRRWKHIKCDREIGKTLDLGLYRFTKNSTAPELYCLLVSLGACTELGSPTDTDNSNHAKYANIEWKFLMVLGVPTLTEVPIF